MQPYQTVRHSNFYSSGDARFDSGVINHTSRISSRLSQVTSSIPAKPSTPLHRYVRLNDRANTEVFTFIVLPQLIRGFVDELVSPIFTYAQHNWVVHFERKEPHLGAFLELRHPEAVSSEPRSQHGSLGRNDNEYLLSTRKRPGVKGFTVTLDYQFMVQNREHFYKNESFGEKQVEFNSIHRLHGRSSFIELADLSSRRFLFDDGRCLIELELKNVLTEINLDTRACLDPSLSGPFGYRGTESISIAGSLGSHVSINTVGGLMNIPQKLHLESKEFSYAGELWILNLDFEIHSLPGAAHYDQNGSFPSPAPAAQHQYLSGQKVTNKLANLSVELELSLVKRIPEKKQSSGRIGHSIMSETGVMSQRPGLSQTNWCSVSLYAELPGGFSTGPMEFLIGPQGWPTRAHKATLVQEVIPTNSNLLSTHSPAGNISQLSVERAISRDSLVQPGESTHGRRIGGALMLLFNALNAAGKNTRPLYVHLQLLTQTPITMADIQPTQPKAKSLNRTRLTDNYGFEWLLHAETGGRLLRLGLVPLGTGHSGRCINSDASVLNGETDYRIETEGDGSWSPNCCGQLRQLPRSGFYYPQPPSQTQKGQQQQHTVQQRHQGLPMTQTGQMQANLNIPHGFSRVVGWSIQIIPAGLVTSNLGGDNAKAVSRDAVRRSFPIRPVVRGHIQVAYVTSDHKLISFANEVQVNPQRVNCQTKVMHYEATSPKFLYEPLYQTNISRLSPPETESFDERGDIDAINLLKFNKEAEELAVGEVAMNISLDEVSQSYSLITLS
ncbi:unnamed protein product [Protopolystoma xenopodis]|uniref:Uncharacterized protein n=1 Tax=Protopolystoma xenopodis TaxID=117903 RepID=A0A448WBM0_9PLAT|nr:unnamed protein product [Protopolystoma xenopodis]